MCLYHAFHDFEEERLTKGITGRTAGYRDDFSQRNVNIQIDLY